MIMILDSDIAHITATNEITTTYRTLARLAATAVQPSYCSVHKINTRFLVYVRTEAAVEWQGQSAPQPEAPIDNDVCRERLLQHIQQCQVLIDARLDSIEAQVAGTES